MEGVEEIMILLVEDDPGDRKLIKSALLQQKFKSDIHVTESGEQALDYLNGSLAGHASCPWPDLILLDLNMPGMGGKAFLGAVKEHPDLRRIPVVILTTSDAQEDILNCYELYAAGYIKKPMSLSDFQNIMKHIEAYWFAICRMESKHGRRYLHAPSHH